MSGVSPTPAPPVSSAYTGISSRVPAVLAFPKDAPAEDVLQVNAVPTGPTDVPQGAWDCGEGYFIETLYDDHLGEPYYRSCSPGGAICRYSSDLWQAEMYIKHLKGTQT
jgi:hypothetical protein